MSRTRNAYDHIRTMRENTIQDYIAKRISSLEWSKRLCMHVKSFLRLVSQYRRGGSACLVWKKPWPKSWSPDNRTPEWMEKIVENLACTCPQLWPVQLAQKLEDNNQLMLHPTTIYRILKRRKIRYCTWHTRWKQDPKLYAYDEPWAEIQLDASFPFGRSRKIVSIDAIDDCSRFVWARLYDRNTIVNAKDFVTRLVASFPGTIKAIRTDNGFDTKDFREHLATFWIILIVNPPYTPEHNGKIERFHKTMKQEFYWRYIRPNDEFDTIQYQLQLWLNEYNYRRRHSGLKMNGLTPAQKLVKSYLEATNILIPIIREPDFHERQESYRMVTWILQQYKTCRHIKKRI